MQEELPQTTGRRGPESEILITMDHNSKMKSPADATIIEHFEGADVTVDASRPVDDKKLVLRIDLWYVLMNASII